MSLNLRSASAPQAPAGAAPSLGGRLTLLADLAVITAVALFATWTVLYLAALAGLLPSAVAFWGWVASSPLVVLLSIRRLRSLLEGVPGASPWAALMAAAGAAAGALLVARPDLDDASYVVRSTWIAANGDVRVGDVIFSDGAWPGLPAQIPYLPSIEALLGWVARASGISAGSVVYVVFPPLAAAGAIWALWMLLRAWRVRRPSWALALAAVFLLLSGAAPASWGNLHFARIWQGKITFVALVLPLFYAVLAAYWSSRTDGARRAGLVLLAGASIAGVGLTPAAIFVVPGVVVAGLVPGLLQRRWAEAARVFAAGAGPALGAGVVMLVAGRTHDIGRVAMTPEDPWLKVLGTGVPAAVVLVAAVVAVLACLWSARWSGTGPVGRQTALAAVAIGVLVAVPILYDVAIGVMGTDAIAWRLTWIVPVPALVGVLAVVPLWSRRVAPGVAVAAATAAALVWGGLPVWSPANGAWVVSEVAWKMAPVHLEAARWAAGQQPTGRVLAPVETSAALGVVTADVQPVGSRDMYMAVYDDQPGSLMRERWILQRLADGGADPLDLEAAPAALVALRVQIACAPAASTPLMELLDGAGYAQGFTNERLTCFERPVSDKPFAPGSMGQ